MQCPRAARIRTALEILPKPSCVPLPSMHRPAMFEPRSDTFSRKRTKISLSFWRLAELLRIKPRSLSSKIVEFLQDAIVAQC